MEMLIAIAIIDEAHRQSEEWRKNIKKYGAEDKRTKESYYKYLGLEKARVIAMELLEGADE